MSVKDWRPDVRGPVFFHHGKSRSSTFTFDMERLVWTHVGEWLLPFKGRGYYHRELDAWVGICLYKEGAGRRVCCCDVPPASGCETMPASKLGRDVFYDADRGSRGDVHLGATLVYRGKSRFCLLETRVPRNDGDPSKHFRVVKMTSFALKYNPGVLDIAAIFYDVCKQYASFTAF
ncbi:hypothetical protein PR202_gb14467 [Eleusine coracana subsp. coracana]|uniref:Uncharacterized protein n=1 Tax=Eleusine coracana subsp. coracana TaxID=191504 RepID=A0AAV5EWE1_ELECO|nr:hypothetical protein PR202_gb14467 [Eleusine coracana subsp. coracana]